MKKGKLFKQTISCLLAVLMIAASLPISALSASAASDSDISTALSASYAGVLQGSGNSRWTENSNVLNLVNDQCESNFDIGYVTFDISGISASADYSVKYKIKVNCATNREALGISFYYPKKNLGYFLKSKNTSCSSSSNADLFNNVFYGEKVDHIGRATSYFGLKKIGDSIDTTADGKTYSYEIDVTSAVRYAATRGNQYATLVILAAKQGGYKDTGGEVKAWSDTDVYLNETSASLTYSVNGTKNISDVKLGVIYNGSGDRYKTSNGLPIVTVANDKENSNFTIGYASFDVSGISDYASAKADFTFNESLLSNESEAMGVSYYYPTANLGDFTHANGAVNKGGVTSIYKSGNNSDYISSAKEYYGLVKMGNYNTVSKENVNRTIDISSAINDAISRGETKARVVFMLSAPGGAGSQKSSEALDSSSTTGSYWSDTMIQLLNNTFVDVSITDRIDTSLDNVVSNVDDFDGYKATFDTKINSQNSSSYNVLYSSNPTTYNDGEFLHTSPSGLNGDWWTSFYIRYCVPTTTFLYDGSQPYNTVLFAGRRKDTGCNNVYINMVYPTTGSGNTDDNKSFALKERWTGYTSSFGVPSDTSYQVGYSSSTRYGTKTFADAYYLLQNKLYYTGTPSTTLTEYTSTMYWRSQSDGAAVSTEGGDMSSDKNRKRRAQGTDGIPVSIRIVNVKSLIDIVNNLKNGNVEQYNKIVEDKSRYYGDENAVTAYLNAINAITVFNPNDYFSASNNGYSDCVTKINQLYNDYNSALRNLKKKYEIKFVNNSGTVVDTQYAISGSLVSTNAENSPVKYVAISENNDKHNKITYVWPTVTANADQTVSEIPNTIQEEHTKSYDKIQNDSFDHKITCSVCNYEGNEPHNWGTDRGICTDCNYQRFDSSAYNNAVNYAFSILSTNDVYTISSKNKFNDVYKQSTKDYQTASTQEEVDKITWNLICAEALLETNSKTITVELYDNNNSGTLVGTYAVTGKYGKSSEIKLDEEHNIVKWEITTNGSTQTIYGESKSITYFVTSDATVKAYYDDTAKDTSTKYTKVLFKGINGKVVDVKYVKVGDTLDTSKVSKPSVALYNAGDWSVATVEGKADVDTVTVTAAYTPDSTVTCGIHMNNSIYKLPYNTKVDLTKYSLSADKKYALSKSESTDDIIAYLDGTVFYVPARSDVYVIEADEKENKIEIVGAFSTITDRSGTKYKTVGFNCKYSLQDGCTPLEWGIMFVPTLTAGGVGNSAKLPVKAITAEKEFTAQVNLKATSSKYSSVKAKAYLKYRDATGAENTIYGSAEEMQSFVTTV